MMNGAQFGGVMGAALNLSPLAQSNSISCGQTSVAMNMIRSESVYSFCEHALNVRALRGCAPAAILSKPGIKPDFR